MFIASARPYSRKAARRPTCWARSEKAFSAAARLAWWAAIAAGSSLGRGGEAGERGRQQVERDRAGGAGELAVGGDPPAFGAADPVSEIFAVAARRIAAREGEIAVGEAVRAVGGDAAADRRPGDAALAEGGAVAEGGDRRVAAGRRGRRPDRHHHLRLEHRREAVGGARGARRRGPKRRGRRRAGRRPRPGRAGRAPGRKGRGGRAKRCGRSEASPRSGPAAAAAPRAFDKAGEALDKCAFERSIGAP